MLELQIQKKLLSVTGDLLLNANFSVENGERIAIIGLSGSGKTTFLRLLAGLVKPDKGHILFENQPWFDSQQKINLPPQKRPVGLMFQNYALFPNMTVQQNLTYALQKGQSNSIIPELIDMVELTTLKNRYPATLSGGQQQRVALARALVTKPKLLLLDEPLSSLDRELREKLQTYILDVQKKYNLTLIWVTHDANEVEKVAQRVFDLNDGKLVEEVADLKKSEITGKIKSIESIDNQQIATIILDSTELIEKLAPEAKVLIRIKE